MADSRLRVKLVIIVITVSLYVAFFIHPGFPIDILSLEILLSAREIHDDPDSFSAYQMKTFVLNLEGLSTFEAPTQGVCKGSQHIHF